MGTLGILLRRAIVLSLLSSLVWVPCAQAESMVIDGPGFKVEKRRGWFGHKSTVYQDALGNKVEKKTGWFGRQKTHTKLFGSEATQTQGGGIMVQDASGKPLVTQKRTLFHGTKTHVDGNGIYQSVKDLFKP